MKIIVERMGSRQDLSGCISPPRKWNDQHDRELVRLQESAIGTKSAAPADFWPRSSGSSFYHISLYDKNTLCVASVRTIAHHMCSTTDIKKQSIRQLG